jgi:hypothetical protein
VELTVPPFPHMNLWCGIQLSAGTTFPLFVINGTHISLLSMTCRKLNWRYGKGQETVVMVFLGLSH